MAMRPALMDGPVSVIKLGNTFEIIKCMLQFSVCGETSFYQLNAICLEASARSSPVYIHRVSAREIWWFYIGPNVPDKKFFTVK